MHTLIRDAQTTKHDFVFYADRLIRLVIIASSPITLIIIILERRYIDILSKSTRVS